MFVDASAIVPILTRELEADALADALDEARSPIISSLGVFESVLGVCRTRHASVTEAATDVGERFRSADEWGGRPVLTSCVGVSWPSASALLTRLMAGTG